MRRDKIDLIGNEVAGVKVRSGRGEVIRSSAADVTFRFLEGCDAIETLPER